MENRLKERLTGAAILVALIVLVVPEMFHGQRSESSGPAGGAGEGPPIRSYIIDLGSNAARDTPLQVTPGVTPRAPAVAPPAPAPAPASANAAAPVSAVSAVSATSSRAEAASPAHSAMPTTPATQGHWSVQLGLFAKRDNAERLMDAAQNKGFDVSLSGPDVKGHYRVHATGFATRTAAAAWAQRLKGAGFASAVSSQ